MKGSVTVLCALMYHSRNITSLVDHLWNESNISLEQSLVRMLYPVLPHYPVISVKEGINYTIASMTLSLYIEGRLHSIIHPLKLDYTIIP